MDWRGNGAFGRAMVRVGCWQDTNDDSHEWAQANEGALALEACVGMDHSNAPQDTRGSFARAAWPGECVDFGAEICAALRAAAKV